MDYQVLTQCTRNAIPWNKKKLGTDGPAESTGHIRSPILNRKRWWDKKWREIGLMWTMELNKCVYIERKLYVCKRAFLGSISIFWELFNVVFNLWVTDEVWNLQIRSKVSTNFVVFVIFPFKNILLSFIVLTSQDALPRLNYFCVCVLIINF